MPDVSMTTSNVSHLLRLEEGQGQLTRASVSETLEKCALGSPLDGLLTSEMAGGGLGLGRYWGWGQPLLPGRRPPSPSLALQLAPYRSTGAPPLAL